MKISKALMRGFSLFACLYWCANANPALADSAQIVAGSCRPLVTITPDNDVRLDDDKRPPGQSGKIPDQVLSKIRTLAAQALRKIEAPDPYPGECEDLYGKIFRISAAPGLYLYAAEISPVSPIKLLFLILFDPATGALTKDPPRIEMKSTQIFGWKDPLLRQPLISLAGLPINQSRQIVVEERVHNGTMYNAVVYNYFEVGPDLSLTRVLAFEPRAYSIGKQEGLIVRTLQSIGPNQQRLESSLETNAAPHQRQDLGYVILERAGPGHPFQVKERHPKSRNNDSILVTYSGAMNPGADDKFLREGYTFHY